MARTKTKSSGGGPTAEQRKAQPAPSRQDENARRKFNDVAGFWRVCRQPLCRRRHACSRDSQACFTRHWRLVPEDEKEYLRACLRAANDTRSPDAIHRAGIAARDACLKRQDKIAAMSARPTPSANDGPPAPDARVRRL